MLDRNALRDAFAARAEARPDRAAEADEKVADSTHAATVDRTTTSSVATSGRGHAKPGKEEPKQAAAAASKGGGKGAYSTIISRYAASYGVPVSLAHAVVKVESNFRPDARGRAGEIGLMQIKPSTARMMGFSGSVKDLYHPETNIRYGMKYLAKAHQLGGGSTCGTILKYNAGHGATRMNKVSAAYCAKVKRQIGS